jgi:hypothetical protein
MLALADVARVSRDAHALEYARYVVLCARCMRGDRSRWVLTSNCDLVAHCRTTKSTPEETIRAPYAHAVAQRDETQQRHVGDGIQDVTRARG